MNLSWDFFITMFFVVMSVYGLLLGRSRVYNIMINTFVGYVIAFEAGEIVFNYLTNATLANNVGTSHFGAKLLTFAVVVFILTLKSEIGGYDDRGMQSTFITAGYGCLAAGLILSSAFSFMSEAERFNITSQSNLATLVADYRLFWLIGPIAAVMISSFLKNKSSG